jgi:YD repeat-containing protein
MCEVCAAVGYDIHAEGFQANSTTAGDQTSPNIARLPNGTFIVLYRSNDTAGNGTDIRARIFFADGTPTGTDFLVNQTTAGDQTGPAAFFNSDGTLSLLWQTPDPAVSGNTQLMVRSFDLAGNALGAERQVSQTGSDGAYSFTQRSNGNIFITYENNGDVYGRVLNASWTALAGEVQLNTTTTGNQTQSRLLTLSNGNILVSFQSADNGDGSGTVIRNRVFSPTDNTWAPVTINGNANDFIVNTTGAGDQTNERTIRLSDNRVLEVWQSTDPGDGSGGTIRARIIGATGDLSGASADFIVNTTTAGNQQRPAILGFDDGRRLIYWHSFETGTDTIRGRFVHANGTLDASDFVIANLTDTTLASFSLSLLANQQVVYTYQGVSSGDGAGAGVQSGIGSVGSLTQGGPFPNTGTSQFDIPLPSKDWDQAAAQISRGNAPWNDQLGTSHSLSYAYRATSAGVSYSNGASGFNQFNAAQIATAEAAIQLWEDIANINLTRVQDVGSEYSNNAQFLLWNYDSASAGSQAASASGFGNGFVSGGSSSHSVYLNDDRAHVTAPTFTNDGFRLFIHEIGHALGLSHPGNYNIQPGGANIAYDGNAIYRQDSDQYTVMSYFDESITHANFVDTFAMTPLLHDIAAMQRLYGANTTTRAGDTTYGFNATAGRASFSISSASQHAVFAVWDGGGTDTLDFSGYDARQYITLVAEQFSSVGGLEFNVAIARGSVIENAIGGSSSDVLVGNAVSNTLAGGAGSDTFEGGAGADKLTGGVGGDRFVFTATALADAQAGAPLIDWITDFNRGNGGTFNAGEGDRIDVTPLVSAAFLGGQQVGSLVRVLSDGTNARLQIDPDGTANGPGWVSLVRVDGLQAGNQLGVFVNGTASAQFITVLGSEIINNQDGSRVDHRVDALNQQPYTDYYLYYDALGRLTAQTTNNDDGSHLSFAWDVQNQQDWADYYLNYDAQNRVVSQVTHNDDGSRIVFQWDIAGQQDWADYRVTYDGQDRPITQVTHNDDGSQIVFKWDVANQADWSDYRVTYDSQDRPITQVTNNDNGSQIVIKWDVANQFNWSDYYVTSDSLGRALNQVTNNDDGTHLTYGWDVTNQDTWSEYVVTTDSQNRTTEQTTRYDDGTYTIAKWDVQNQFNWREMTDYYDAQGQHVQQRGIYDDGSTWMT